MMDYKKQEKAWKREALSADSDLVELFSYLFTFLANEAIPTILMPKKSILIGSASETGVTRVIPANTVENAASVAENARANDIFFIFPPIPWTLSSCINYA